MQELKTFIDFIQGIGFVGLLILLAIPKSRKWLGFNGNGHSNDVPLWAQELKMHYNDETTQLLKDIHTLAEDAKKSAANSETLLTEIQKYGIKCRK